MIWDGRLEHSQKAQFPIFVTLVGILMLVSDLHPEKALFPMFVTLFGISIQVSELQRKKAEETILVTPLGILMLLREQHKLYLLLVDYQYYTL